MSKRITNPDSNKCRIANPTQQSVAERGVEAVALLVGLLEGGGAVAGAVLLEDFVLLLEGGAELLDGTAPEVVLEADFLGALADGVEVLIVRRVGRAGDADGFDLLWDLQGGMGLLG